MIFCTDLLHVTRHCFASEITTRVYLKHDDVSVFVIPLNYYTCTCYSNIFHTICRVSASIIGHPWVKNVTMNIALILSLFTMLRYVSEVSFCMFTRNAS